MVSNLIKGNINLGLYLRYEEGREYFALIARGGHILASELTGDTFSSLCSLYYSIKMAIAGQNQLATVSYYYHLEIP